MKICVVWQMFVGDSLLHMDVWFSSVRTLSLSVCIQAFAHQRVTCKSLFFSSTIIPKMSLGGQFWSSGLVTDTVTHWAISLAQVPYKFSPWFYFLCCFVLVLVFPIPFPIGFRIDLIFCLGLTGIALHVLKPVREELIIILYCPSVLECDSSPCSRSLVPFISAL